MKAKDIFFGILFMWFVIVSVFLVLGEPEAGSVWDNVGGILTMKALALVHIFLGAEAYRRISKEFRDKVIKYLNNNQ